MTVSMPSPDVRSRPRRSRLWRWSLIVGIVIGVQSVTITPPVTVRFVDAQSEAPLVRLPVTAVWNLVSTNLAGSLPSTTLKVRQLQTDQAGTIKLGPAVMLHAPTLPFSWNLRQARFLPALYVVDERYRARRIANIAYDPRQPAPLSVLSLQRTSINGTTVPLVRAGESDDVDMRFMFLSDIRHADELCRQRWLCQED